MANLLFNGSFEYGHHHQDGTPELTMPDGWRLHFVDGVSFPGIGEPDETAARPETVVWHIDSAPAHEQPLFFLRGSYCLKVFKSYKPVYFALTQHITNLLPGSFYTLRVPIFPDLVMDYQDGQKVYADDGRSGGARLGYSKPGVEWPAGGEGDITWGNWSEMRYGNFNFGQYNYLELEFPVDSSGEAQVWIEVKAIWALPNNGFFLDDFRLLGPVGPVVIGPTVEMSAEDQGDGAFEVRITSPEGLPYVDLEVEGGTVGPVDVQHGGLGFEWVYPVQLPAHGLYEMAFYARDISPRVFMLDYRAAEPPLQVDLAAGQITDNHFRITASCRRQLTSPSLELPGAVVGEVEGVQITPGWEWRWEVRLPQGVSGRYTATFSAVEIEPQTIAFEYQYVPPRPRGAPREQYARRAFVYHPDLDYERFTTLAVFCYQHKYTLMSSADDGGIGDLDQRIVVIVSPGDWGDWMDPETGAAQHGLNARWYELYYPGVQYYSVEGETADELDTALQALDLG